jgi:hypothetical protein
MDNNSASVSLYIVVGYYLLPVLLFRCRPRTSMKRRHGYTRAFGPAPHHERLLHTCRTVRLDILFGGPKQPGSLYQALRHGEMAPSLEARKAMSAKLQSRMCAPRPYGRI